MIRGVRSLNHMILENVCMDVCVCVRIPLYLRIYSFDFNRAGLIFSVFLIRILSGKK